MSRTVLVTGATGYIARHIVARLLDRGDTVIGSARDLSRDREMRDALRPALRTTASLDRYRTVALDLTDDSGWPKAMDGVDVLIHTASPFPMTQPKDPQVVIKPAVDGAVRALRAAQAAGVKNVVFTSSSAAVMEGQSKTHYDETDWTPDDPGLTPYIRSKTLAERAAWEFVETQAPDMRLAVINPTFVQGAPLGHSYGTSIDVIKRLLDGKDPMLPRFGFMMCHVEDVAEAHIRAAEIDAAAGNRHIVTSGFMWFSEMADAVRSAVPDAKASKRVAPNALIRMIGLFDPAVRSIVGRLGEYQSADADRLRNVLGIEPRSGQKAIAESARWLAANR